MRAGHVCGANTQRHAPVRRRWRTVQKREAFSVTRELRENPPVRAQPKRSGQPGWELRGWARKRRAGRGKPKQGELDQASRTRGSGRRGRTPRTNQPQIRGSFRCPDASWNLGPGTSSKPGGSPPSSSASALRGKRRPHKCPGRPGCPLP